MAGVGVVLRPHTQPSHGTTRPDGLDGRPLVRMAPCGRLRQRGGGRCVGTLGLEPTVQMSMALSPDAGAPSCIPEVPVCLTSVVSLLSPIPPEGHILTGKNLTGVNTGFVLK